MTFWCREKLQVQVYKHPHHQSLNEQLMQDFIRLPSEAYDKTTFTNIKGKKLYFVNNPYTIKPEGVELIERWVKQIINKNHFDINFQTWAAWLNKGEETVEHHHYPICTMFYVYFVNTPKGSSPLVFPTSGKKVKAEAGTLVLAPSIMSHKVPPNKCDNRVTIASNINFRIK